MPLSLHTGFCFLNSHDSPSQSFGFTQWAKKFLKEHCILIFTKIYLNPDWHELRKQEKGSSLVAPKAKLQLLKLLHLFARDTLENEETTTT